MSIEAQKVIDEGDLSYQSDNLRDASADEDESEKHLGRWRLSQDATGDDTTIWNLRRKGSGSNNIKMLQLAIKLSKKSRYIVPLIHWQ